MGPKTRFLRVFWAILMLRVDYRDSPLEVFDTAHALPKPEALNRPFGSYIKRCKKGVLSTSLILRGSLL